jgi:hypothetical protein
MKTQQDQENASPVIQQKGNKQESAFKDERPETVAQGKLYDMVNRSQQVTQMQSLQRMVDNRVQNSPFDPIQRKENKTGLPDNLKTGMENLSGMSLDDVKVHRNSDKPAQLQAHAYAQGTDIHLGPGQEKYLPHEAWHVVQQKQGRVKPTMQMKGKVNVNDDSGLEREADVMGAKSISMNNLRANNILNQGITQKKNAPIQGGFFGFGFGGGTKLTDEVTLIQYGEDKFKEIVQDRLIQSKDLRRALGGAVRSWSSLGMKTTDNRALRDSAKGAARGEYNVAIDAVVNPGNTGDAMLGLAKDRAKVEAYAQSKDIVEAEIGKILLGLVTKAELSKQPIMNDALAAFNTDGANHTKIQDKLKERFRILRTRIKDEAIINIDGGKHPIQHDDDLTTKLTESVESNDYSTKAATLVTQKLDADNVGAGMRMIGGIINMAVPFPGTEASLEIELTIPVGGVGVANAYLVLKFGGEASKDEDSTGKQEIGAKAKMSFGAKFEVAQMLDFSVGIGGFIEAQAQDTDKLMSLFSYGGYRLADGISKKLSSTIWGYGGKTGQTKQEEAARWADAMEEDALVGDNYVELGAAGEVGAEVNVGIGKLGLGLEIGGGKRYDESTKGRTGLVHNDGKKTFFVNASAEIEPNFEGFGASFGISGSFKRVRDYMKNGSNMAGENEWEFVIGAKLSTGLGNSKNEKVDKIIRWISAIAGPAATWANMFTSKSQSEATEKVGAVGQTVSGVAVSSLLNSNANSFAEGIVSKMGAETSSLTGDLEDNLQNNGALALEATITHDGDGWNISFALKEIKTTSVNVGIVKGTMEKSTRLVEVGTADGGYIKGMGLNKTRTP